MSLFAAKPPKQKPPAVEQFSMPTCAEGLIIGDLLGVGKYAGNILWYGGSRTVAVEEKQDTPGKGGGGSTKVTTGYKYYLSWMLGLCEGPVDALYSVWAGEELLWEGNLVIPASGGVSSITLKNMGTVHFYFGTTDQPRNATMESDLTTDGNHPSRNLCYAFFDDCLLGEYNRVPAIDFVIGKFPAYAWSTKERIGPYGYNPAQAIYYLIDEHTEMPISLIDETVFAAVADELYSEARGIKVPMVSEQTGMDYIEQILTHIDATFFYADNSKFKLKLLRGDEDTSGIPSFAEVDFVNEPKIDRDSHSETVNEVKVEFLAISGLECPGVELRADEENNPETIAPGTSQDIFVLGGVAPYVWSVSGGLGHSISSVTGTGQNALVASAGSCGPATVVCTDACGESVEMLVRNVSGVWVQKFAGEPDPGYCGLPGREDSDGDSGWSIVSLGGVLGYIYYMDGYAIEGNKRQQHYDRIVYSGTSYYRGSDYDDCMAHRFIDCSSYRVSPCLKMPQRIYLNNTGAGWYEKCADDYVAYSKDCVWSSGGGYWVYYRAFLTTSVALYVTLNYWEWECP
jgi:hypothetical protein